jgi:hypothetical protein
MLEAWKILKSAAQGYIANDALALQLLFRFEVGSLSDRLMSSTPE